MINAKVSYDFDKLCVEEFEELNAEIAFDFEKLCVASTHGIPDHLRLTVWKILLNIQPSPLEDKYDTDSFKALRGEACRYFKRRENYFKKELQQTLESVITIYLSQHHSFQFSPSLIPLCGVLLYVFQDTKSTYHALTKLIDWKQEWAAEECEQQISDFLMLFRMLCPNLYSHFEDEEVDSKGWVRPWFDTLLSKQLPIECIFNFYKRCLETV